MWWLIPAGIGLAVVYSVVSEQEKQAYQRWQQKKNEVEDLLGEVRLEVHSHLYEARQSYNFQHLRGLHSSSVNAADQAYQLLKDSGESLHAINKMLTQSREQRSRFKGKLERAHLRKDFIQVKELKHSSSKLKAYIGSLFREKEKIKKQRNRFRKEVRMLNRRTCELKETIRDYCGEQGEKWYLQKHGRRAPKQLYINPHTFKVELR
jgi:hypothetical protein